MNHSHILLLIFSVLIGAIVTTNAYTSVSIPQGVTCAGKRASTFGWTDKRVAMAELAAIVRWQTEVEEREPGFGQWYQARKRTLSCRLFKGSSQYQCRVTARPCRFDRS